MLLLLCLTFAAGQPIAPPVAHAVVTAQQVSAPVKPGSKTTLIVDVVPRAGIHVYAPPQTRYKPIAIVIDPADGVKIAAPLFPPASTLEFEGEKVRVFDRAFQIRVPITVASSADMQAKAHRGETIAVSGRVTYQACDDIMCYVPRTVPVKWDLMLKKP
jgi:DsbC/DsbD-like thiol-disulfide interchange protein